VNRLGFVLAGAAALPAAEFADVVRETEAQGYHTAWTGETGGYDAIAVMATILAHSRTLHVGSAVVPVQTRTPTLLGMSAATLGHLAPGRVALGIGLSSRIIVEQWHGVKFSAALAQIREAVQIIRLVASGERVNFEGTHYRVKNFRLTAPAAPVRIVLAALGPEMLELAGEIADGVVLNWIPPEAVPASLAHLQAGARRAGRALDGFEIACFIRTCVTDDVKTARTALARDITGYAIVDVYAAFFRTAGFGAEVEAVNTRWRAGDRAGAVAEISPRVLDGLGVVGDEAFCRARIDEFARAGLTMPVVLPFNPAAAAGGDPRPALLRTLRAFGR